MYVYIYIYIYIHIYICLSGEQWLLKADETVALYLLHAEEPPTISTMIQRFNSFYTKQIENIHQSKIHLSSIHLTSNLWRGTQENNIYLKTTAHR